MNIRQIDIAQMMFLSGIMLLAGGVILIPGPRFMERLDSTLAYLAVAIVMVATGALWLKYIELKETMEQEN